MAKMVKVSVYETNSRYSSHREDYGKIKKYMEKNNIPYSSRVAYSSTGEMVIETTMALKQVKKMAKETGTEFTVMF